MVIVFFVVFFALAFFIKLKMPMWKGKYSEKLVHKEMLQLPDEYVIFNDLLFESNGRSTQIDHIVVSPYGVFVIETKGYKGWILGGGDEVGKSISKARRNFVWKYRELEFESSTDLTEYLKQHGYPKISMSTVTGLARGGKYTTYQELMGTISKIRK